MPLALSEWWVGSSCVLGTLECKDVPLINVNPWRRVARTGVRGERGEGGGREVRF